MIRRFVLHSVLLSAAAWPLSAYAQTPQASTITGAAQQAGAASDPDREIVVTGSRGLPRTVTDSPVAIDVIGGADIQKTGRPGLFSAINNLVPSFNLPTRAGGGTSTVIATGGLRGLNPDQTLVLVNGKRRHKTSLINIVSSLYNGSVGVDLDLIPEAGVDHIEVLRDGAAAQYGSDAIAGVINVLMKKNKSGFDASFTAGQNMDRSDGETYRGQISYGQTLGDRGFLDLSLNLKKVRPSNRANEVASSVQLYNYLSGGRRDPREATIDREVTKNYGGFPSKQFTVGYNTAYDLGGVEAYSFGTFSQRNSQLDFTFRAPNNAASLNTTAGDGPFPDGFRPSLNILEQDYEFAVGLRGSISGWEWDLSSNYGNNRSRQEAHKTINASLGPSAPRDYYVGTLRSNEWDNQLDVTRGFDIGSGKLQVSAGLQHRREFYGLYAGEPAGYAAGTYTYLTYTATGGTTLVRPAPGAQAAAGFQPGDASRNSRNSFAGYVDLSYDPTSMVTLGAAGRVEHYDDGSGTTATGKGTIRVAPSKWIAFRGAISNGFRAPSLAQQYYAATTGQFRNILVSGVSTLNLLQIKTLPVGSAPAIALGARPLRPETSFNLSGGIVLTPTPALTVTADAYQIKVYDRVALTSTLTGTAVSNILIANGLTPDISAQYYSNAIDTRTRGIDIVGTYRLSLSEWGTMRFNAGFNYNKTIITRIAGNPSQLAALGAGYVLYDRLSQGYLTTAIPKTKIFLGDTWTWRNFTVSARANRYGAFTVIQNTTGNDAAGNPLYANDRHYGAKWITDLEVSWQLTKFLNIAAGANNLFNVYPDAVGVYNANIGTGQYPTTTGYGFTGGSYYARIGVSF
jgi:iron complex outermembrane recepter protein